MKIKNILFITIPVAIFVAGFLLFFTGRKFGTNFPIMNGEKLVIENPEKFKDLSDTGAKDYNVQSVEAPEQKGDKTNEMGIIEDKVNDENVKSDAVSVVTEEKKEEVVKEEKKTADIKIIQNLVSWGFASSSDRKIDAIVIHSSYDALGDKPYNVRGLIDEYKQYGVAPHYLIDREGSVYQLVADSNVAYHAGQSKVPDGRSNVNDFSLGIELMNTKEDEYTAEQYVALGSLLDYLKGEYKIKYVLGHSQISPGRKDDPWNFDWSKI